MKTFTIRLPVVEAAMLGEVQKKSYLVSTAQIVSAFSHFVICSMGAAY